VAALLAGVKLVDEDQRIAATHCEKHGEHALSLSVAQGKYHQVKRMLAAAGNHCVSLQRTRVGGLTLDSLNLAPGEWCYLDDAALARLVTFSA
jgi:16S rRNA pseudouridine516 synthase